MVVIVHSKAQGLTVTVSDIHAVNAAGDVQVQFYDTNPHTWHPYIQCGDPLESTASSTSFQWITNTLKECEAHEKCRNLGHACPIETTCILNLRDKTDGNLTSPVRIVSLNALGQSYACLSHSWGSRGPQLQLRVSNMEHLKRRIVWEDLPKSFQDAIVCCRRLGLDHLWIDSLCIVQDDIDDWKREATKMSDIYSNCYLCIAATHNLNDSVGLFSIRHTSHLLTMIDQNGDPRMVCVRKSRLSDINMGKAMMSPNSEQPLLTRGWVLQERLLAPRVLYFCKNDIVYDCHESFVGEHKPAYIIDEHPRDLLGPRNRTGMSLDDPDHYKHLLWDSDVQNAWRDIVEIYTKLDYRSPKINCLQLRVLQESKEAYAKPTILQACGQTLCWKI